MASNSMAIFCLVVLLSSYLDASEKVTNALLIGEPDSERVLIKFLHRDHLMSPLHDPEIMTQVGLVSKAVQRSHARNHRFGLLTNRSTGTLANVSSMLGTVPVESQVYAASGEFVMTGSLGSPPVDFVAILDTGSDLIWLQCKQCFGCLKQRDPLFDPTKSVTFKQLACSDQFCKDLQQPTCSSTCPYVYGYGDGSNTSGILASDTAVWPTTDGRPCFFNGLAFGCGLDNQGYFAGVDGIVGFGRGPLSLPSQIGYHVGRVFSYCLGDFAYMINQSSSLVIGNHAHEDIPSFKFTPLMSNDVFPTFYYVHLKSIKVQGKRLPIHPDTFSLTNVGYGGTIVDSGTTLTYLPQTAYDAILNRLLTIIAYPVVPNSTSLVGLDLCYDVSGVIMPSFPAISFRLSGATLRFPAGNVFISFSFNGTSLSCLAMAATEPGSFGIIGNYQQQNFHLLYDLEHSQLGFKEKNCLTEDATL